MNESVAWTSASVEDTAPSVLVRVEPAATVTFPVPPETAKFAAVPVRVQAPPVSADPQPPATVLANASFASRLAGGTAVTVTSCVTAPVTIWLSVTVSVTG